MVSPNIPRCSVNLRTVCIEPASHAGARCITMNHSHQPLICTIASITHQNARSALHAHTSRFRCQRWSARHDFIVRYEYSAGVSAHPKTSSAHAYATRSALPVRDLLAAAEFIHRLWRSMPRLPARDGSGCNDGRARPRCPKLKAGSFKVLVVVSCNSRTRTEEPRCSRPSKTTNSGW